MEFVKIINEDACHYGYTFRDGLNVDVDEGFHFTTRSLIAKYVDIGSYVCEVVIPDGTQITKTTSEGEWRAPSIMLDLKNKIKIEDYQWTLKDLKVNPGLFKRIPFEKRSEIMCKRMEYYIRWGMHIY